MSAQFDSLPDALSDVVKALGGAKAAGALLWPEKEPVDAGKLLRHCLDPDRPEKLSLEQVVLLLKLGRERRCHSAAAWLLQAAGYREPVPVEPEDERATLQREFVEAARGMERIVRRMDGLGLHLREVVAK